MLSFFFESLKKWNLKPNEKLNINKKIKKILQREPTPPFTEAINISTFKKERNTRNIKMILSPEQLPL